MIHVISKEAEVEAEEGRKEGKKEVIINLHIGYSTKSLPPAQSHSLFVCCCCCSIYIVVFLVSVFSAYVNFFLKLWEIVVI